MTGGIRGPVQSAPGAGPGPGDMLLCSDDFRRIGTAAAIARYVLENPA